MKILFVFTGGTIGSTLMENYISPDSKKSLALLDMYSHIYGIDFEYDVVEPYSALSENNTGVELSAIIGVISKAKGYDGIIVVHGTDTVQYTAAALGIYFGNECLPVCLVSSNYPIENDRANGLYNLFGAVMLVRSRDAKGVFVAYKNENENKITIHRATRLLAHQSFSDALISAKEKAFGFVDLDGAFYKSEDFFEKSDELEAPNIAELSASSLGIIRLSSYVGMVYPRLSEDIRYILIDAYHSGTLNVKDKGAIDFFLEAKERGIRVFMSGATNGAQYLSAESFEELSIIPIEGITPIALYIKLWFYSLTREIDKNILLKSRGGDIC